MLFQSFHPKKKKTRWLSKLILSSSLSLALLASWYYGPNLYYRYSGDSLFRTTESNTKLGQQILWGTYEPLKQITQIAENRKQLEILKKSKPTNEQIIYQLALLDFFELLIRMPIDDENLIQLTGRGFLPSQIKVAPKQAQKSSIRMALNVARGMRKALALQPELKQINQANVMLVFCDFIYTGRMDPQLLLRLESIQAAAIPDYLQPAWEWIALSLYTLKGQTSKQQQLLKTIASSSNETKPDPTSKKIHLKISKSALLLLRCYGDYYAKHYYQALIIARRIQANVDFPLRHRIEAARMVAEIFLIQRGKANALYFMNAAWQFSQQQDGFIKERINQLSR